MVRKWYDSFRVSRLEPLDTKAEDENAHWHIGVGDMIRLSLLKHG